MVRVSPTSARSEAWYKSRFGFVSSDEVYLGERDNVITAFMRCDRGDEYTDHHTFLCIGIGEVGFDHAAFEVEDIDAVMAGHDHLKQAGYEHHAGSAATSSAARSSTTGATRGDTSSSTSPTATC